jgi:hypothetical protein
MSVYSSPTLPTCSPSFWKRALKVSYVAEKCEISLRTSWVACAKWKLSND